MLNRVVDVLERMMNFQRLGVNLKIVWLRTSPFCLADDQTAKLTNPEKFEKFEFGRIFQHPLRRTRDRVRGKHNDNGLKKRLQIMGTGLTDGDLEKGPFD
jgi:hypothetical protein